MSWLRTVALLLAFSTLGFSDVQPSTGLCHYETAEGGLTRASCQFPSCPDGLDCRPPTIDRKSATITYDEPFIQWKRVCPEKTLSGSCWEVHIQATFHLTATDPSGVAAIAVHIAQEIDARRTFKKYWSPVDASQRSGSYQSTPVLVAFVSPGQRLDLAVYELCARDKLGNEGCALPPDRKGLEFSLKE